RGRWCVRAARRADGVEAQDRRARGFGERDRHGHGCRGSGARAAPEDADQQRDDEQHQEDEEQHLRNFRGPGGDPAEPEDRRDDGDDEENDRVVEHWASFLLPKQVLQPTSGKPANYWKICRLPATLRGATQAACQTWPGPGRDNQWARRLSVSTNRS